MQVVNIMLIILGLIVCFGGIYFRKPIAAIAGFINGLFLGGVIFIISLISSGDTGSGVLIFVIAFIVAGICYAFDKLFVALSAFISSLLLALIIVMLCCSWDTFGAGLVVVLIISTALAIVSFKIYEYSYIVVTAFTGALSAAIGFTFLVSGETMEDVVYGLFWGESSGIGIVILITIGLTIAGICVQLRRKKNPNIQGFADIGRFMKENHVKNYADQTLRDEIRRYPITFFVPIGVFVVTGIATLILVYSYAPYEIYIALFWISIFADGIAIACFTYAAYYLSVKYCVIIQIAYAVGMILERFNWIGYYNLDVFLGMIGLSIIWGIVYAIRKLAGERPWTPYATIIISSLIYIFVFPYFGEGGYIDVVNSLVYIAGALIAFVFIYRVYNKIGLGSVKPNNNGMPTIEPDNDIFIRNNENFK